ncbi:MAG: pyridoxamine 5'-phosphate oxidase family protein [Pyrinomonadaceae bacterium]
MYRQKNPGSALLKCLFFFSVIIASATTVQPQEPLTRARLITGAREVITAARYCALITLDAKGRAQARTLDPFAPDVNMVIRLGTNSRSRKVAEIRRNPRVTLYYFDREGQGYVTIRGTARLVNDPIQKAKWWKDEWKTFYPDREKDYLLIVVTPERLEVISEKLGIPGDPETWKPPSVSFRERK